MNNTRSPLSLFILGTVLTGSGTALAADIHVNSRADLTNATLCTSASPACTLRKAIEIADSRPGEFFNIFLDAQGSYFLQKPLKLTAGSVQVLSAFSDPSLVVVDGTSSVGPQGFPEGIFMVQPAEGRSPSLQLVSVTLANSKSTTRGGAVHVARGGTVAIRGSVIRDNQISSRGGGLWLDRGTRGDVYNTRFENNRPATCDGQATGVQGSGGAIAAEPESTLTVASSFFTKNKACRGAAIFSQARQLVISNSTFTANEAVGPGGALLLAGTSSSDVAFLRFNTISRNTAGAGLSQIFHHELTHSGGMAIRTFNGRLTLSGNLIAENSVAFTGERRVTDAVGTKGADCLMEDSSPTIDTWRNFFGTAGATSVNRVGTATTGAGTDFPRTVRLSDCVPFRSQSFAGIDTRLLNPQLSAPALAGTTLALELPVMIPASTSMANNNFRDGSTSVSQHGCFSRDQRGFVRPQMAIGICEIGAVEIDGTR